MNWFSVLKTDAEDRAMQFIEEAVEGLSYAKIVDNEIWLTPNWVKDDIPNIGHMILSTANRKIKRFIIKLNKVHKPKLCIYYELEQIEATKNKPKWAEREILLCLDRGTNPNNAVPADSYVTVMMLMGNKEEFLRLWD
tara:strand:+ start:4031 stop:4444 length:414 start_codon:yes stop_codon:yes gene_type:complete